MNMEWYASEREKPKYSEKNLSQRHFIHHESYWTALWWGAHNYLPGLTWLTYTIFKDSVRTVKETCLLGYNNESVTAVEVNNCCVFWKPHETYKSIVGRKYNF